MKTLYWGDVTNPLEHNPDNFRYLVHMDTGRWSEDSEKRFYVDNIDSIFTAPRLSTSLISNNRKRAFVAIHGFIVGVPECDVLATHSGDMWSSKLETEHLMEQWPVQPPEDVLNGPSTWPVNNEVIVSPEQMTIMGILVTATCFYSDSHSIEFLCLKADELLVPIVTVDPYTRTGANHNSTELRQEMFTT